MDAIVSALAYAELKRLSGDSTVVAGRCGNTNVRIDFVLGKFGVEPRRVLQRCPARASPT